MKIQLLAFLFLLGLTTNNYVQADTASLAPDFELQASDGATYTLSQFKGRQAVVIAFFPKAFTGG